MVPADEVESNRQNSLARKRFVTGVLIALLGGAIVFSILRPAPSRSRELPDFNLSLINGNGSLSKADLAGKPVVVNFWASWCIPCREETPLLERTHQKYEGRVEFVGVNTRDDPSDARGFMREFDVTYDVVADRGASLAESLGVFALPQTFFVDADGNLVSSTGDAGGSPAPSPTGGLTIRTGPGAFLGAISSEQLEHGISLLLEDSDG